MRKQNPFLYYQLAKALAGIRGIPPEGGTVVSLFSPLFESQDVLRRFIEEISTLSPSASRAAAIMLKDIDGTAVHKEGDKFAIYDKVIGPDAVLKLKKALSDLEIVLAHECPGLDIYAVSPKGIYATSALLERADDALRGSLTRDEQALLTDDVYRDFREAGRCLALELPTAAGFHIARSVEAVVRRYWSRRMSRQLDEAPRLAAAIQQLRKAGEDPKVMDILDHFRDLHRNTLMHPEAFLDVHESMRLFDIAKSAISAVASRQYQISASSGVFDENG